MWRLRSDLTAHDAAYVAVAEVLDRPPVTLDAALARAPGHGAVVDLVG
jgi:predicted nucleic acid-binding protein